LRTAPRLALNRETLRSLAPHEVEAIATGLDRTIVQVSNGNYGLCSVSMGVTGQSLGCTTASLAGTLATSVVSIGVPH